MLEGWTKHRIDELGNGRRPVLKAGPFGSSVTKSTYQVSGYKVYGQQEVVAKDLDAESYFVSMSAFNKHKSCAVEPGDILMTMMGTIGRVYRVPDGAPEGIINPRLVRISFDHARVIPEFAEIALDQTWLQRLLERRSHGGTMPGLNLEAIASINLSLPPRAEQRRIAEILRTWDDAIAKLEALRAATLKRRVWFRSKVLTGRSRLPGFSNDWENVAFADVLDEHGEPSNGAEEVYSVSVHKGLINQIEHLGRSFAAANTDHYNRVLPGDIVYTKSPTGDFPLGIIKQSKVDKEVIVSPLYGVFTPETHALGVILDAYFESPVTVRNYLSPLVQKGAKNTIAITNKRFLEGKLRLPRDPAEQEAIAHVIKTDQIILEGIEAEITALQRQKRGLMQKLLTGEWRVKLDTVAETAK